MIFPAVYALAIGFGMIVQWSISYFSHQIPELTSEPIRIRFHLGQ